MSGLSHATPEGEPGRFWVYSIYRGQHLKDRFLLFALLEIGLCLQTQFRRLITSREALPFSGSA